MILQHNIHIIDYSSGTHKITAGNSYNYLEMPSVPNTPYNMCNKDAYASDKELIAVVGMDLINNFGVDIIYYPTSYNVTRDRIFGEDGNRIISQAWDVKSYFQLPKENKVWDKFGITGINDFSMIISKRHFDCAVEGDYHPQVGDLVLSKYDNKLYEIAEVKEESTLFLMSKQYSWELIVRKAKIESTISIAPELVDSPISKFYSVDDIFDIRNQIDIEKEDILYKPEPTEKPNKDPFGTWG